MKRYCPNCGFGTEYISVRPTACGKCRSQFEQPVVVAPASVPAAQPVFYNPAPIGVPRRRERPAFFEQPEPDFSEDAPRETNFDPNDTVQAGIGIHIAAPPSHRRAVTLKEIGLQQKTGFRREGGAISAEEQKYIAQIMANKPAQAAPAPAAPKKQARAKKSARTKR